MTDLRRSACVNKHPVVAWTLNPYMLDECDLSKDEVLIVFGPDDVRLIDRKRVGSPVPNAPQPRRYDIDGRLVSLGRLWYERGEAWLAGDEEHNDGSQD